MIHLCIMKRIYQKPAIDVQILYIEECIANASSTIRVGTLEDDVTREYELGEDDNRHFDW